MQKTIKGIALALLVLMLCPLTTLAEGSERYCWYAGLQGGLPFTMSTASSFGGDKTRLGWSAGVFAGKQFSDVFSAELQFKWARSSMSPRGCCAPHDNWLGTDGCHYFVPVLNMDCLHYNAIMSKVFMQSYGVQLNISLLPLVSASPSRWTVQLSPGLSAYGSKASIHSIADDSKFVDVPSKWNVGLSCNLNAGYALTPAFTLGVYTGVTFVTGDGIDGMPRYLHSANTVWDSGIRLTYNFKKGGKQ